jgi:chitodextrinase
MRTTGWSRVSVVIIMVGAGLALAVSPADAAGGTNVLSNGGFESGGGSLAGWSAVSSKVSLAADGDGGGHAALVSVPGKAKRSDYGLTTSSPPVTGASAGATFAADGKVRSDAPGGTVCLVLDEHASDGTVVRSAQQCGTTTKAWTALPTTTLTVRTPGDSLTLTVKETNSAAGQTDSFEADSLSLIDTDTTPPTVPSGLKATAPSVSEVDLSWQASSDANGVAGYVVRRDGTVIATLGGSATTYRDTTVKASTTYSYSVAAFDSAQNYSDPSAPVTVSTPAPPADQPPTVPGGVTATAASSTRVNVAWTASTDTDATGVAGYVVRRDGATIATLGASATSYADTTVQPSTTYSYTVTAFDTANNSSAASAPVTVSTPPASTAAVDDLWHMNETSGTTMADSGSTPHPGTLHNIALGQSGDPAFAGTSYGFNGTSSFVDVGTSDDLNAGSQDVRIGLSLNTTTVPPTPDYDLFRKGQYPGTEYKLELQPNGEFSCEFRTLQADGTTVKGYTIQPAIDLHDGKWHRLTCSKVGGTMTVTVDGVAFTKSITGSISNNYHMIIGAYSASGGSDFYQGRLDEVSFRVG